MRFARSTLLAFVLLPLASQSVSFPAMAQAAAGDIIVTESDRVLLVAVNGTVTVIASDAPLNLPAVAVDAFGNYIVVDTFAKAIFRIAPSGAITTVAQGDPLINPKGITVEPSGDYIVTDLFAHAIFRVSPAGVVTVITSFQSTCTQPCLHGAVAMVIDSLGNYVVADHAASAVFRVTPSGAVTTIKQGPPLQNPEGVAIDPSGNIIVADAGGSIFRIAPSGQIAQIAFGYPLTHPNGVALIPSGTSIPEYPIGPMIALVSALSATFLLLKRRLRGASP